MTIVESKFKEIESGGKLSFVEADVLKTEKKKRQRQNEFERVASLDNLEQVKLIFFDDNIQLIVCTTIGCDTDKIIILRKGLEIPSKRIYKVI